MSERKADIGVLGLGTMGSNLALNFADNGRFDVALFNRTVEKADALRERNPALAERLRPTHSIEAFVEALERPRMIVVMVDAGPAVDAQIALLKPHLADGDMLIDAGNADFNDTIRRSAEIAGSGIHFTGMGVSGGELGARHGPSIMVGGPEAGWARLKPLLEPIAARYEGEPCVAWLGTDGAGHFVKTIHNGIEYADMQMIAEIYGLMRDGMGLSPDRMAEVFAAWNKRGLSSYLVEITATVLAEIDPETGRAMVDVILDEAGQKGTGRWSAIEAQKLGVGATTIEAAVSARGVSARRDERETTAGLYVLKPRDDNRFETNADSIDELERALETAKIIAYAQGYATLAAASQEHGWNLPLGTIARIWRAGCIIRSRFLGDIASAYDGDGASLKNLLHAPVFVERVTAGECALRRTVAKAALSGIAVPALSAALAYFDDYRRARGTANLTQAQRDLFGAHTFRRVDKEGIFHHQWPAE